MHQFIAGFVVALLAGAAAVVLLRKRPLKTGQTSREYPKQLEELARLAGELAHEIKNPLSTIKINLKLISEELENLSKAVPAQQHDQRFARMLRKISVIQKEADRLEQILGGFLRYIDRTQLQLADVDVNELISEMADFYTPQAHSHSITIRQGLHPDPLVCKIDADMLKQVVLNLFINAQQAMSDGGELLIKTRRQEQMAVIEIADTGIGIAPDKLADIFDAYYSLRPHGSGLGLPTAKKIVESHKGTLCVTSNVGKGTLFMISLPIKTEAAN